MWGTIFAVSYNRDHDLSLGGPDNVRQTESPRNSENQFDRIRIWS